MRTLLAMPEGLQDRMFSPAQRERLAEITGIDVSRTVPDLSVAPDEELVEVEVLVTGWGSPVVDAAALARMPRLRAIVHTAGTVRFVVADVVWDRGDIVVTSATKANAVPVAEYALAQILLAGKRALAQQARYRRERTVGPATAADPGIGNHGGVVGLIGASRIGTLVAEHLRQIGRASCRERV